MADSRIDVSGSEKVAAGSLASVAGITAGAAAGLSLGLLTGIGAAAVTPALAVATPFYLIYRQHIKKAELLQKQLAESEALVEQIHYDCYLQYLRLVFLEKARHHQIAEYECLKGTSVFSRQHSVVIESLAHSAYISLSSLAATIYKKDGAVAAGLFGVLTEGEQSWAALTEDQKNFLCAYTSDTSGAAPIFKELSFKELSYTRSKPKKAGSILSGIAGFFGISSLAYGSGLAVAAGITGGLAFLTTPIGWGILAGALVVGAVCGAVSAYLNYKNAKREAEVVDAKALAKQLSDTALASKEEVDQAIQNELRMIEIIKDALEPVPNVPVAPASSAKGKEREDETPSNSSTTPLANNRSALFADSAEIRMGDLCIPVDYVSPSSPRPSPRSSSSS